MKAIKTRQIKAEDVPQIIAIQQAIIKKKVSRRWVQMVENHLRKQDAVGFVATRDKQESSGSSLARSRAKGLVWSRVGGSRWLEFTRARWGSGLVMPSPIGSFNILEREAFAMCTRPSGGMPWTCSPFLSRLALTVPSSLI